MTQQRNGQRDGIIDPATAEMVKLPPELQAFDHWLANRGSADAWQTARSALASTATDGLRDVEAARLAYAMARGPQQEQERQKLAALLDAGRPLSATAAFRPASEISHALPRPLLRANGKTGAVLAEGAVCLLSGAGGAAKSTLAATVALDVAFGGQLADPNGPERLAVGLSDLFDVRAGPVMMASYEDPAAVVSWRLGDLTAARGVAAAVLDRIHVADMAGLPLYGPPSATGLYNTRPEPLRGWAHLWEAADRIRPALVVIDPALDAYTGEANNLAAVREFMSALTAEARARSCGVVLVAHSRKAARRSRGEDREDPYDAGQVGGVAAWSDAARGVLTLTGRGDDRTLAVAKANWGRAFISTKLQPVNNESGALVGFDADGGGWVDGLPAAGQVMPERKPRVD